MDAGKLYFEFVNSLTNNALPTYVRQSRYDPTTSLEFTENKYAGAILEGETAEGHMKNILFRIRRRRIENNVVAFYPCSMEPAEICEIVSDFAKDPKGKKIFIVDRKRAMRRYTGPGEFYKLDADWLTKHGGSAAEERHLLQAPQKFSDDFYRKLASELFSPGGIPVAGGEHVYYHFNRAREFGPDEMAVLEISCQRAAEEIFGRARLFGDVAVAVVDMRPKPRRRYPDTRGLKINVVDLDDFAKSYAGKAMYRK